MKKPSLGGRMNGGVRAGRWVVALIVTSLGTWQAERYAGACGDEVMSTSQFDPDASRRAAVEATTQVPAIDESTIEIEYWENDDEGCSSNMHGTPRCGSPWGGFRVSFADPGDPGTTLTEPLRYVMDFVGDPPLDMEQRVGFVPADASAPVIQFNLTGDQPFAFTLTPMDANGKLGVATSVLQAG